MFFPTTDWIYTACLAEAREFLRLYPTGETEEMLAMRLWLYHQPGTWLVPSVRWG